MSDSPTNPIQQLLGNLSPAQLQLVLQVLEFLLGLLVVKEPIHGLRQIVRAVRDCRQMVSVFWDKVTTFIFVQVNDSGLSTSRHLRCVRSHLGGGSLLPGKYGVTYLLQLSSPFSHGVDVAFDSVQVKVMASPAISGVLCEGAQGICREHQLCRFLLDLGEEH